MAKKIKTYIKLTIPAGAATAAPPVGPAFNEKTKEKSGNLLPVVITVFEDRTFTFITKQPPIAEMIKKALKVEKGAGKPGHESAGTLTKQQAEEIAKNKLEDLNTNNVEAAMNIVAGVARSMGVKVA